VVGGLKVGEEGGIGAQGEVGAGGGGAEGMKKQEVEAG
jgi:hypothetical protein